MKKKNSIVSVNTGNNNIVKKAIITLISIAVIFFLMYFLTTRILEKDKEDIKEEKYNAVIQYDKILAGESFNMEREEYLVVYYDATDEFEDLSSSVSAYQSKEDVIKLYSVDLGDFMNKKYITDGDIITSSPSELRVRNNTMLRFKAGEVTEVFDNKEKIKEYLSE